MHKILPSSRLHQKIWTLRSSIKSSIKEDEKKEYCCRHPKRRAVIKIGGLPYCKLCINKKEKRKKISTSNKTLPCYYTHPQKNKVMADWLIDGLPLCEDCVKRWDTGKFLKKEIFSLPSFQKIWRK